MAKGKTTSKSKAAPVKATAKKPAKAPVKATTKAVGKAGSKPAVNKAKAKATVKAPAKAASKAAAKPATKPTTKPATKPIAKSTTKPTAKPTAKPVIKQTVKPTTKAIAKPAPQQAEKKMPVKAPEKVKVVEKPVVKDSAILATGGLMPPDYDPTKDKGEFMNPIMKEFFRLKLISWREELIRESSDTIHNTLQSTELQKPDLADRAAAETDHALELRTRDRERKLISKINEALLRLEDSSYGYCEETGEPITIARLVARPTATLSLEAQERHERMEKTHRDD